MALTDIGIDLGTYTLRIYQKGRGVTIREPSIATYDKDRDEILAFGEEARQMMSHTQGNVVAVQPLRQGSIVDYPVLEEMLKFFIVRAMGRRAIRKPHISICLPSGTTSIEQRAIEEVVYQSGARDVIFVDATVAAAIGAGIDIVRPAGNLIVDIGGGTTDIGILSIGDTVLRESIKVGGGNFTESISRSIRRMHGIFIDESKAEEIKFRIGNCYKLPNTDTMQITGRNVTTGTQEVFQINSEEVRVAMEENANRIAEAVHGVLERTPPELAADIVERGIVLTGGGALLQGLEELIAARTGINTMVAQQPELATAIGTGFYTQMMEQLEE